VYQIVYQNYELAKECVETDFFGAERVTEALLPLLQLSTSPRIVNISGQIGLLKVNSNKYMYAFSSNMFSDFTA